MKKLKKGRFYFHPSFYVGSGIWDEKCSDTLWDEKMFGSVIKHPGSATLSTCLLFRTVQGTVFLRSPSEIIKEVYIVKLLSTIIGKDEHMPVVTEQAVWRRYQGPSHGKRRIHNTAGKDHHIPVVTEQAVWRRCQGPSLGKRRIHNNGSGQQGGGRRFQRRGSSWRLAGHFE
jgi:hypothetical protein